MFKKIITGNGRAPKKQIQLAVQRELQLDKPPEPPKSLGALAAWRCPRTSAFHRSPPPILDGVVRGLAWASLFPAGSHGHALGEGGREPREAMVACVAW